MSYTFEKITKKTWTVTSVYRNFMSFETIKDIRKDVEKCEICLVKFSNDSMTHLAMVKGRKNHIICTKCQEEAEANGVEMQYKRSEEPQLPKFD